ncbi:MAG: acyltransferase family protein [Hyphomicrobiaceae bacterium]
MRPQSRSVANVSGEAEPSSYVAQIDGLRAIAVLAVIGFHTHVPGMTGGFVGVDVFFVISGFLITGLLLRELEREGRLDIPGFYARRVRRLLPALAVVLIFTLVAGRLFLTPVGEQQGLAASAVATATFLANIFFWRTQTGYFAGSSEEQPLLHMWTLAVEEQFYLVWPVAMIMICAFAKRRSATLSSTLLWALAIGTFFSLTASIVVTYWRPPAAFYLTPFRAWEFGAGALLGLMPRRLHLDWLNPVILAGGLLAIFFAIATFGPTTAFPGYACILPVSGTAGILYGLSGRQNRISQYLAARPLVAIGKLSYGWYLWHWPLLAIARAGALGQDDLKRDLLLVLVALGLSLITYVSIEEPIRRYHPFPFNHAATSIASAFAILALITIGALSLNASAASQLAASPLLRAAYTAQEHDFPYPAECSHFDYPFAGLRPVDGCLVGAATGPMIMLWGDSNAFHLVPAFAAAGIAKGQKALPRASGDCRPYTFNADGALPGQKDFAANCAAFNSAVLASLSTLYAQGARVVALAARWSVPARYERSIDHSAQLEKLVRTISEAGFRVILIADVPGYPFLVPHCVARKEPSACTRNRVDVDVERGPALDMLKSVAHRVPGTRIWDPIDGVCGADVCRPLRNGVVLVRDTQHLSVAGAEGLARELEAVLTPEGKF